MRKLARYFVPYWAPFALLLALVFGQTWTTLSLPNYMASIIDNGIVGHDNTLILHIGQKMLIVALIGGICMIGASYMATRIATGFAQRIREAVFTKVEKFSLNEFNNFSTASLITRSTNDVQQIQQVLAMLLRIAFLGPFMGIGAIIKAYQLAPSMTWIMAVAIIALIIVVFTLFTMALPRFQKIQKLVDQLNLVTREMLTGIRVIRAFNREKYEETKFDAVNKELRSINTFVNRLLAAMQPTMMLIMNGASVLVVWIGAHEVSSGTLQIGGVLAFVQYSMQGIMAFLMISIIFVFAPRALVSAERIGEVLDVEPVIKDPKSPKQAVPGSKSVVAFRNVSFVYEGAEKPVLDQISFSAYPGQVTAIVGSTGSGKSTLVNLIPRFYDATSGQVTVDGIDVKDMSQKSLRSKIGYVPQKAMLFSGSIESNLKFGKPEAGLGDIQRAASVAQASEFINKMSEKMGSSISQGGINLSGGQKQRLSIARALVYDPEIYIFDDSFSAIDFATDAKLRKQLEGVTKDRTVIIVAQRISTIMHADNILVLDEGRIVGLGTHEELLKNCRVYREIAKSQLSDNEIKSSMEHIEAPATGAGA